MKFWVLGFMNPRRTIWCRFFDDSDWDRGDICGFSFGGHYNFINLAIWRMTVRKTGKVRANLFGAYFDFDCYEATHDVIKRGENEGDSKINERSSQV